MYSYLRNSGGRLSEDVGVPLIMEPFLSGLEAIHQQVRAPVLTRVCVVIAKAKWRCFGH